jgi:hypothetical protein
MQCSGVVSSVRRRLTTGEHEQVMESYWGVDNRELAPHLLSTLHDWRLDDCSKFRLPELLSYAVYPDWCITGNLTGQRMLQMSETAPASSDWSHGHKV